MDKLPGNGDSGQEVAVWRQYIGLVCLGMIVSCSSEPGVTPPAEDLGIAGPDAASGDVIVAADGVDQCQGLADGASCDDSDPCTLQDQCAGGVCVGLTNDPCDSENPCEEGTCVAGEGCSFEPAADGTACSATCFTEAACVEGACTVEPESKVMCPTPGADQPCVGDLLCDPATGECTMEVSRPEGTSCDTDSNLCTLEACNQAGVCLKDGDVNTCEGEKALNPCEFYVCNPKNGECKSSGFAGAVSCDDGNACTYNDTCEEDGFGFSSCKGAPFPVDDDNPCTDDSCADGAVVHSPIDGIVCDPEDPCSPTGLCADGTCNPATPCACTVDSDCAQPEDLCLGVTVCDASGDVPVCAIKPDSPVVCPVTDKSCYINQCVPATGACVEQPYPDETPCDDDNVCTAFDTCQNGLCTGGENVICSNGEFCDGLETCDPITGCNSGEPPSLDDGVSCTLDTCDDDLDAVLHAPVNANCDDGSFCNGAELCDDKAGCFPGVAPEVDDGVSCTTDVCDDALDKVVHTAVPGICDDGEICTADVCDPATGCENPPEAKACDDGDACTAEDACQDGSCLSGAPLACDDGKFCNGLEICDPALGCVPGQAPDLDDGIACTLDSCDEPSGEVLHIPDATLCDDGFYCNGEEACVPETGCVAGAAPEIDDAIDCTADSCDEEAQEVVHEPTDAACDNGQQCDGVETCDVAIGCTNTAPPEIDDGVPCTLDVCDDVTGEVQHIPNDLACSDSLFCTGAETCDPNQGCLPGSPPELSDGVSCTTDLCDEDADIISHVPADVACDDGIFCNGAETCDVQQDCLAAPPLEVSDGLDCTLDTCDEENGVIVHTPSDLICDDGLFCNGAELCDPALGCQPAEAPELSDAVDCTTDACDEANDVVTHTPLDVACADGLFCNGSEICDPQAGCQPSSPPELSDQNDCTVDQCDEANDAILHTPNHAACDDALFCNGAEQCDVALGCQPGEPPILSDEVGCTVDSCDELNDKIIHIPNPAACDDGLFCTGVEPCDPEKGCEAGAPPELTDNIDCTVDSCDEATDQVLHVPDAAACDNGQFCDGEESCSPQAGCVSKAPPEVSDNIDCTLDVCDDVTGEVVHIPNDAACDNGLFCDGAETCLAEVGCVAGPSPNLGDGVPCTVDSCDEANDQVIHIPNDAACDNGLFCDGAETCDAAQDCQAGTPPDLSDDVGCTVDSCDEANDALVHIPNDAACDNGLFCDGAETCDVAQDCQAGTPPALSDNVGCTVDSCDEANDILVHIPDDATCDNGLFCDGAETCDVAQDCQPGTPPALSDNVGCTVDSCDEVGDILVHLPNDALCDNSVFCDGAEICDPDLGCLDGQPPVLDDGVGCTADTCDEVNDVVAHTGSDGFCDDGAFCNGPETCDPLLDCQGGIPPNTNDEVSCTVDACDEAQDVVTHTPNDASCDDGAYCNGPESCNAVNGCVPGSPPELSDGVSCTVDTCDEVGDLPVHTPDDTACDNGLFCDGAEACDVNLDCINGAAPGLDDGVLCTVDACDENNDVVTHTPDAQACDDGLFCNGAEPCDVNLGCGVGTPPTLSDPFPCTVDSCDEAIDQVVHTPDDSLCVAGGLCTAPSCSVLQGCSYPIISDCCGNNVVEAGEACDDGDGVSLDGCSATCVDECAYLSDGLVDHSAKVSSIAGNLVGPLSDGGLFGTSVAHIGDLNGDGVEDIAVGNRQDDDGAANAGAVWILFLTQEGEVQSEQKISASQGGFTGQLDAVDGFGSGVTSLGDLDGDGVTDLAVGAYDDDDGGSATGSVWILFLKPDGTVKAHQKISMLQGGFGGNLQSTTHFGRTVVGLGDLDKDGVEDLAVGAFGDDDGGQDTGSVWILFLNTDGTVKSEQKISATQGGFTGQIGTQDLFGSSLARLGDLDGDTVLDLAVGAPLDDDAGIDHGAVWVLFLKTDGTVKSHQKISSLAGGFGGSIADGDFFGEALASAGDLDGDGIVDLAIGTTGIDDGGFEVGGVWVTFLNVDGTVRNQQLISHNNGGLDAALGTGDYFGISLTRLGGPDTESRPRLAVGAYGDDDGSSNRGAVWIVHLASTCQVCGDGVVEEGEQCDDGNALSGDGCSGTCQHDLASGTLVPRCPDGPCVSCGSPHSFALHTCATSKVHEASCWGYNSSGQAQAPAGVFDQVAAGDEHSCGLRHDGTVVCWGSNSDGQLDVPLGELFNEITAGAYHSCGLKQDGKTACWGTNGAGASTPPNLTFVQIEAGGSHTCGLQPDGFVVCWGDNASGQGTPPNETYIQVSAGMAHSCGLRSDQTVICWGSNAAGQSAPPALSFDYVTAGANHTCAVRTDGSVKCWGENLDGQSQPPAGEFTQLCASSFHSCGVRASGTIVCWGDDTYGQSNVPGGL